MKFFRDAVHGDISLSPEEVRIIDTPEFQRLRGIRQLGTSYLVFPCAHHTRFEHSLGTCWLAKRMVEEVNERSERSGLTRPIDEALKRLIAAAALLHDVTHIPFGHTFEDERRILPAHDDNTERLGHFLLEGQLGSVLKDQGLAKPLFRFFTQGKAADPAFPYQLVAGPVCADLLDYLRRDAFFCGLHMNFDDRIFKYLNIQSGQLCFDLYSAGGFRQDAWSELINLLRIRFHLTERVYFHHTKMISGAMLSRLLEVMIEEKVFDPNALMELRDDSFLYVVQANIHKVPQFSGLLDSFLSRRLFKRVYMVAKDPLRPGFPGDEYMQRFQKDFHLNHRGARTRLEHKLAKHLGIPESAVIIYAPDTHMRLKEARLLARVNNGPLVNLDAIKHPELDALRNRHEALWRFFLFMDPAYSDCFVKAGRFMERQIGLPNQLELFNQGQLTLGF